MNIFNSFREILSQCIDELRKKGELPSKLDVANISVEPPRNRDHGDISTNAALVMAPGLKLNPREVAQLLARRLA